MEQKNMSNVLTEIAETKMVYDEERKQQISKLVNQANNDIKYIELLSQDIISSRTKDLDALMNEIYNQIIENKNASDELIEQYFLELTNALYFINSHCEFLGFYEDVTKTNAKLAYNKGYAENQLKNAAIANKTRVADNQLYAENASINENIVNLIYSRSYKIIKVKVDAANEMVRTLSKIISAHMQEKQLSMYSGN